jgi:hypothetical protein
MNGCMKSLSYSRLLQRVREHCTMAYRECFTDGLMAVMVLLDGHLLHRSTLAFSKVLILTLNCCPLAQSKRYCLLVADFGGDIDEGTLLEFVDAGNDAVIVVDSNPSELMRCGCSSSLHDQPAGVMAAFLS